MTPNEAPRRPGRRHRTVRGLLALVAVVALGLAGYRHVEPWLLVRKVHPQMAPFASLFHRPTSAFRCASCHAQPEPPADLQVMALLESSPHGPGKMLDCKTCHAR